jgi:LacI family transcriptional regulator
MSVQLVSREAGVSVATVSRVINHSRSVAPRTVEAVQRAMKRVGYVPPPLEKRQRRSRHRSSIPGITKGNIALLFPDVDDRALATALSGRFMRGVGEVLGASGLNMIVTPLAAGNAAPPCIRDKQVDAVIVRGCDAGSELLPLLGDLACVWLLDGEIPWRGDHVLEDNATVARMAVRHLAAQGCRKLAVINPMGRHHGYRSRADWFSIHARRSGLEGVELIRPDLADVSMLRPEVWEPALLELVERFARLPDRPDGLFLPFPDELVTFVYRVLGEMDVKVGRDVEVVCCSYDPPRLATLDPAIAHVDIQPEAMGRAAVETLLWRMRHPNEPQRRVMVVPSLVEGRSLPRLRREV